MKHDRNLTCRDPGLAEIDREAALGLARYFRARVECLRNAGEVLKSDVKRRAKDIAWYEDAASKIERKWA